MAGRFEEKKPTYTRFLCKGFCTMNQVTIITKRQIIITIYFIILAG